MAESNELSIPEIKGVIPSNPKELKGFTDKLQVGIDLVKTALKQRDIEPEKYKAILKQGREWAELKLRAELKLKNVIELVDKKSKWDNQNLPNGELIKGKTEIIQEEFGLTKKQQEQISKLTKDGVDEAIKKSKENDDIPTRYSAIRCSMLPGEAPKPVTEKYKMYINIKTSSGKNETIILDYDYETELNDNFYHAVDQARGYFSDNIYVNPPFSYVGGKTRLMHEIMPMIEVWSEGKENIVSPFLGAGAIELNLGNRSHNVIGYDGDKNVANLWTQIMDNNKKLKERIHYYIRERRMDKATTSNYKKIYLKTWDDYFENGIFTKALDKAAIYWILIMTSYGSRVRSRSAGKQFFRNMKHDFVDYKIGNYNRFTQEWSGDEESKYYSHFTFGGCMSFEESINKHPDDFLYCDPPYINVAMDYGTKYNDTLWKKEDHQKLADILHCRKNWILSYNDDPEIIEMYKDCKRDELEIKYSISNAEEMKVSKELLIYGPMAVSE
ncbi:hypothetical protein FACS1894147_10350 [Spirochaetia bacterium]|nr:hypothetical protein FACS1894147_10350 [Spirochaetia bacterium]